VTNLRALSNCPVIDFKPVNSCHSLSFNTTLSSGWKISSSLDTIMLMNAFGTRPFLPAENWLAAATMTHHKPTSRANTLSPDFGNPGLMSLTLKKEDWIDPMNISQVFTSSWKSFQTYGTGATNVTTTQETHRTQHV
jgi:hypothetical protein